MSQATSRARHLREGWSPSGSNPSPALPFPGLRVSVSRRARYYAHVTLLDAQNVHTCKVLRTDAGQSRYATGTRDD